MSRLVKVAFIFFHQRTVDLSSVLKAKTDKLATYYPCWKGLLDPGLSVF